MRFLPVLFCFLTQQALAQLDPGSAVLVGSGSASPSSGLQSGRYASDAPGEVQDDTVETKKIEPKKESAKPVPVIKKLVRKKVTGGGDIPMAVIEPKVRRWITSTEAAKTEASVTATTTAVEVTASVPPAPVAPVEVKSAAPEIVDEPEFERIQIELLTGIVHSEAISNSIYRGFAMNSPIIGLGGEVWLDESMGFAGRYQSTLSADIASATTSTKHVPITREWSELRWNFRKPITTRNGMFLQYGLVYFEDSLKAPSDETSRVSLKSSGFGGSLGFNIPHSGSYSSTVSAALFPRIRHSESATGLSLESGSSPTSTRLDVSWGGNLRLAQAKILFWDLSLQLEKNQYEGNSNQLEPSGVAAENVSVMTNTVFFHLGYRWGR